MRVALICPYSLSMPGGVQGQVLGLAQALRDRGADARVIAPCDGPPPAIGVTSVGSTRKWASNGSIAPITSNRTVAKRTLEALRSFQPNVIHLHEPLTPGPTHSALLGADAPKVGTFHAAGEFAAYRYLHAPLQNLIQKLTIRTAVSEEARKSAEQHFGGHYWVLPNGVDVTRFAKADIWPTSKRSILFVGRHEARKGVHVLLDAFASLNRDATLWIAGDGPETARLQARNIPNVEWLGRITDTELASRMRAATLFCAPSLYGESFGVVLLEAMAAGVPVVASDIPGYRNVAGDAGHLFSPGNAIELRDALRELLDQHSRAQQLIEAGTQRVAEFSFEHLAERFIPVYESAVMCGPT